MKKYIITNKTGLSVNNSTQGEMIESKVERIMTNNEPIEDGAPTIYTERKNGVQPEHDIRTDRFDLALEATGHIAKTNTVKRMKAIAEREGRIYDSKTGEFKEKPAI